MSSPETEEGVKQKSDEAGSNSTGTSVDNDNDFGAARVIVDSLASLLGKTTLSGRELSPTPPPPEKVIDDLSLKGIAEHIRNGHIHNIVVMAGAGISTSAGIPDFRSPGSGLYHNLAKYNLPTPQAIFELSYFRENPEPFFQLAKELWPGIFKPTPCHYFIRLLHEKKLLLRMYTQNIDTLERVAGLSEDVLIEAHGTFHTGRCLECRHVYTQDWMKEKIFDNVIPRCTQKMKSSEDDDEEFTCEGVVKPDIVFFGEALPPRFFEYAEKDLPECDLLIIMGTSLVVHPFASLVNRVSDRCLRLYINLEKSDNAFDPMMAFFGAANSFKFDDEDNYRDVFYQSTCDDGCFSLAELLGWKNELQQLIDTEHKKIMKDNSPTKGQSDKTKCQGSTPKSNV